jgi:hypothetical protein
MHSLFKIELGSDVEAHHRSFRDFSIDPLRSGQYHISEHSGKRRFLELIVAAIVRHASKVIKEPDYHRSERFAPEFASAIRVHPRNIDIPLEDWEEVLRPLLTIREEMLKLFKLSNSTPPWKRGFCDGCSIIDDFILHLSFMRENLRAKSRSSQYQDSLWYSRSLGDEVAELKDHEYYDADCKPRNDVTTGTSEGGQDVDLADQADSSVSNLAGTMTVGVEQTTVMVLDKERDDRSYEAKEWCNEGLDSCLSYLFVMLRVRKSNLRLMAEPVQRLLTFDYTETVSKIDTIPDAQNLLDLIFYTIHNRKFPIRYGPDAMHTALQLALEIYARVPLIPQSLFMNGPDVQIGDKVKDSGVLYNGTLASGKHKTKVMFRSFGSAMFFICQMALVWGTLSHENVLPLLGIYEGMVDRKLRFHFVIPYMERGTWNVASMAEEFKSKSVRS